MSITNVTFLRKIFESDSPITGGCPNEAGSKPRKARRGHSFNL